MAIARAKNGVGGVHPLTGRELRMLRKLKREQPEGCEFLFMSERGAPMAPAAAQKVVKQAGARAGIGFPVHIHMLRHSCGYALINRGTDVRVVQQYLGHASISNTALHASRQHKVQRLVHRLAPTVHLHHASGRIPRRSRSIPEVSSARLWNFVTLPGEVPCTARFDPYA